MKRILLSTAALAGISLAAGGLWHTTALAQSDSCTTDPVPPCASPSIKVRCTTSGASKCLGPNQPPVPITLACDVAGSIYVCEAFLQEEGSTLTYSWTTSSGLNQVTLPIIGKDQTHNPYMGISCAGNQSGTVGVSITNGNSTVTAYSPIYCPVPNAN